MATGMVSISAEQQSLTWLARLLYVVAAGAYVVLMVLTLDTGWCVSPLRMRADVTSHTKGFAFLTMVAATNVLGGASAVVHGWWPLARGLWWFSLGLWMALTYVTLIAVVLAAPKPGLENGDKWRSGSCSRSPLSR